MLETPHETVIDVSAEPDDEATSIRQVADLEPTFRDAEPVVNTTPRPTVNRDRGQLVLAPGGRIGRYELRDKIGQGAFGHVFLARDTNLDRDIAIKVLDPSHATNQEIVQRFVQEARAAARVAHPGIITMLDCGVIDTSIASTAYIAMELLAGESLTRRLQRSGKLRPDIAVELVRQVACALDAAHRANVLHRDLKPDNIFLVPDPAHASGERVKVLDFGLAKVGSSAMTNVQTVFGTPRYMSPEQCRSSGQIDQRSDIYSLGCILFELVCGRPPFDGEMREVIGQHLRTNAPRARTYTPEIQPELDELIAKMLAKDVVDRPQTMSSVQHALLRMGAMAPGAAETILPMPAQMMAFAPPPRPVTPAPVRMAAPVSPRKGSAFKYAALAAVLVVAGAIALVAHGRSDGSPTTDEPVVRSQPSTQPPVVLVGRP